MEDDRISTDPEGIARHLGVSEDLVLRLQRRGVLRRLELSEADVRRRLCDGHLRHRAGGAAGEANDRNLTRP